MKNRITNKFETHPQPLPGEYCEENNLFLIADRNGVWYLDSKRQLCSVENSQPEDQNAIQSIVAVAASNLDAAYDCNLPSWEELLKTPFVETVSAGEDHEFISCVKKYLPYLKNIFNRPILHLRIDNEAVVLSRARKVSSKAEEHLAGHPEDWDGKTLTGIRPKRILSEERYEEWEFYENFIAVDLLNRLTSYLIRQIHTLQKRQVREDILEKFNTQLQSVAYVMAIRISELWAKNQKNTENSHGTVQNYEMYRSILRQLQGLKTNVLYKNVRSRSRRIMHLGITNILQNDPNYKFIPKLWQLLDKKEELANIDDSEFLEKQRKMHIDFFSFTLLYLANAMEALGFHHQGGKVPWEIDGEVLFKHDLKIIITSEHVIELYRGNRLFMRIVPIYYKFNELDRARHNFEVPAPTLILYPDFISGVKIPASRKEPVVFLPISPYDVLSIEHLAREVNWYWWEDLLLKTPRQIDTVWIRNFSSLLDPAFEADGTIKKIAEVEHIHSRLKDQPAFINDIIHHRLTRAWAQNKENLNNLTTAIETLLQNIDHVRRCPICHQFGTIGTLKPLQVECNNCNAQWGIYDCGKCHKQFPYLKHENIANLLKASFYYEAVGQDMLCNFTLDEERPVPVCPYCAGL